MKGTLCPPCHLFHLATYLFRFDEYGPIICIWLGTTPFITVKDLAIIKVFQACFSTVVFFHTFIHILSLYEIYQRIIVYLYKEKCWGACAAKVLVGSSVKEF